MKQKNIKISKAFTLLELLVATTIFVGVMLMASTAITNSSTYLSRLKAMRVGSDESRRIADILGEDIKKANTEISVKYRTIATAAPDTKIYKSGIALFYCTTTLPAVCTPQHYNLTNQSTKVTNDTDEFKANTLVLGEKDATGNTKYKVYFNNFADTTAIGKILYYSESTGSSLDLTAVGNFYKIANKISGDKSPSGLDLSNDITIKFGGYAPNSDTLATATNRQQAYVYFNIHVSAVRGTTNQEIYGLDVLSGITSRNYN